MSPEIYFVTILVLPVTAVIVFAMRYAAGYAAARVSAERERDLAALSAGQAERLAEIGATLKAVAEEQARQQQTLSRIDAMLREVG